MADLIVIAFTLSTAYALLASGSGSRWAALLAALTGLACVLSLTRALYVGLMVGAVLAAGIWIFRNGSQGRRLRHRLALVATGLALAVVVGLAVFPKGAEPGPVRTVGERITSGATILTQSGSSPKNNTFAYREDIGDNMLRYLGDRWPFGFGFVPPATRYVVDLPAGSIRNTDVGLLNGVMTVGVSGVVLLYAPILLMLGMLLKRVAGPLTRWSFVWLGLLTWGVTLLVSSITLVTLFSTTGLAMVALALGYAGQAMLLSDREAAAPAPVA